MKLQEALKLVEAVSLPKNKKGCLVFDIDDTMLTADTSSIGIWKNKPGEKPIRLTPEQFAKDPDSVHEEWYDYREFRDPQKVFDSIVKGTPILRNLKLMDAHIRANYDFCFLTARGLKDVISKALRAFLMTRDEKGKLVPIGNKLKTEISAAVNDSAFCNAYPNLSTPEKKAMVLKNLCSKYDIVKFVDDDRKNLQAVRSLKIPNLQIIEAQK